MTWDDIFRRACERAGLKDQPLTNEFVQLSDDAAPWWLHKNHPALVAYVASRLVEECRSNEHDKKAWRLNFDTIAAGADTIWERDIATDKQRLLAAMVALGEVSAEEAREVQ